ncbi:MAG: germination protein YpeB [Desulfotomaculaceae bacterium]
MYRRWILPVGLLVLALVAGYWGYWQHTENRQLRVAIGNNYQRAFYNLSDHVQNAEVMLGKSLVSADPMQSQKLYEQIWEQSNQALDSLGQLPVGDALLGRTAKFITQLGDYTRTLSEQVAMGKTTSPEQWETLNQLYNQASSLNSELGKIHSATIDGSFSFSELAANSSYRLAREGRMLASGNFQTIDRQMQKYPTLIYDGPFSDHMEQGKARGVTGADISQARAKAVAMKYIVPEENEDIIARVTGSVDGSIPAYRVEMTRRNGGKVIGEAAVADVSKKGGHLIWMLNPRNIASSELNLDEARQQAAAYLKKQGYSPMKESYYQRNDNTITFNFAHLQDEVIIYPDLVKVIVALDNGNVVGIDARSYLMSHQNRNLPQPKLTETQAREMVGDRLHIEERGRLALIPIGPDKEQLTWEFKGTLDQDTYLVYINAMTGSEVNLLRLIQNQDGALTL